ncbi:HEAT repeat domain-containing protein [bacterium]|jgi:HEAT repeat protein|nr:HEAT repeat domain-containing protein [bacterium]
MITDGFQIRFLLTWSLLVATSLVSIHEVLHFPVFSLTYSFLSVAAFCLLFFLIKPTYSIAYLVLFLIPWSMAAISVALLSHWPERLYGLLFLSLLALCFLGYFWRAIGVSYRSIIEHLGLLQRGITSRRVNPWLRDERGEVLKQLNRLTKVLREREVLRQVVSPDLWEQMQSGGRTDLSKSSNKTVYALSFVWANGEGQYDGAEDVFREILPLCETYSGFLNHFHSQEAEVLFFEDSPQYDRNALLMMRDFYLSPIFDDNRVKLSVMLHSCKVRTGIVSLPEGYRHLCMAPELGWALERLRKGGLESGKGRFLIQRSLEEKGKQVFHLQDFCAESCCVSAEKTLDHHIKSMGSARVEDKLVSIRVIQSQGSSINPDCLLALLDDVSPRVRIEAIRAVVQVSEPGHQERIGHALLNTLAAEWNNDCRATLAMALGSLGKKEFVKALFPLLKDENPRVRANTIEAIGKSMDRRFVLRYLEESLNDPNNRSRANAALAIWLMGSKKGLQILLTMAADNDPLHSCSGLFGIGEVFVPRNVQIVSSLQSDPLRYYYQNEKIFLEAREICERLVFHKHPLVERNAIKALRKIRSRFSQPVLVKKLNQATDPSLRQLLIDVLELVMEAAELAALKRGIAS